jgi:predicted O-linked N-acetylglucosamine transferase (SPINDLY family)
VSGFDGHLASYADIDIALDPTPYGGVITTLEAMWMGVPVVTLAGDRVLGRYGHAFVSVLGLSQLSATDEDDYIAKAVALAEDETGRAVLRTSLRERMRASPICDGRAMAASIESAIRGMAKG